MSNKKIAMWLVGIVAVVYMLITGEMVQAQPPSNIPSVMSQGASDGAKLDKGATTLVKWAVYLSLIAGSVSIAAGIVLCAPITGKTREGKMFIFGGIASALGGAALYLILSIVGSVFK